MKGKKVIHWRRPGGNGGTVLISSWKCNFSIYFDSQVYYLDIQAIATFLCLLLVLYLLVPSIHSYFYHTTALLKSDIFQHSKAYSSHSFHFEEETDAYYQLSQITYKFVSFFLLILKLLILPPKLRKF